MATSRTSRGSRSRSRSTGSATRHSTRSRASSSGSKRTTRTKVKKVMHEYKRGSLRSGGSGRKVTSRKQAVAIALSEARRAGGKVPARKRSSSRSKTTRSRSRSRSR